ncbi:MAG TPA: Ca2+-dependent phosphoinositide-specific phospholipase C, partial [Pricia sp.]|nr:Ca2+-dependent phosphoinositide-specific phospholipase C [Pricia sp.]
TWTQKSPALKGAVLVVNKAEGCPEAAFRIVNDPIADFDKIKELVARTVRMNVSKSELEILGTGKKTTQR